MKLLLPLFALLCFASCAEQDTNPDVPRGPLGKADALGSCSLDDCGSQSPEGCWCDELCAGFGDCCADVVEVCELPQAQVCGGLMGATCGPDEYCHYEETDSCGAADQTGTCQTIPEACIEIFAPVCGCDGQTYDNFCFANGASTSVASTGPCGGQGEGDFCLDQPGFVCGEGLFCSYEQADMCGADDQGGVCAVLPEVCLQSFDPVCGCDGQTYSNECSANAAGISMAHGGDCIQGGEGAACGGLAGLSCSGDLYCHYDEPDMCGAADQMGTCATKPDTCIEIFGPVCGCDGQNYSNGCFANSDGVSVSHVGACDVIECGGFFGLPCPDSNMLCVDIPNDGCDPQNGGADCGGMCI